VDSTNTQILEPMSIFSALVVTNLKVYIEYSFKVMLSEPPYRITANEIVADRERRQCQTDDDPLCRDTVDAEELAKYLNMEESHLTGGAEKPNVLLSPEVYNKTYLANAVPGFYIGYAKKPAALADVMMVLSPPLPLKPKRILYIHTNNYWDVFNLSADKTVWHRESYYERGWRTHRSDSDPDLCIPFAALPARLEELFGNKVL